MALTIPVVWADAHGLHDPEKAVWIGLPIPNDEVPARAEAIRSALESAGAPIVLAEEHPDDALLAVHDSALVEFLRGGWEAWSAAGYASDPGQPDVVGYLYPTPGFLAGTEPTRLPASLAARTGAFCYDTMTVVSRGTWEAARAAIDAALTAADLVGDGARVSYACCRPPGHHVTRSAFGGSCYLNNAAVTAQYLRGEFGRVAVLDLDAHHGNGAQAIFADRDDVLTGSVHVDPGAGWFPHYLGFADESGPSNLNVPLAPGAGDADWLAGVDRLVAAARAHRSEALVVPLGVDAAEGDPNAPLGVSVDGFREAGRRLARLRLPTVIVQEGGYVLDTIGRLVQATLEGFEDELSASA